MGQGQDLINIKCDSEPVYRENGKYIKTKIKSYGDNVNANFEGDKTPKRKGNIQIFLNGNIRFCYQSK